MRVFYLPFNLLSLFFTLRVSLACMRVLYVWIKLESFRKAFPLKECSLAFTLSPWILGCNCQAVLLILLLWVMGQPWASGLWAPVSFHQTRCTGWGNSCFYYIIFLCPVSLSPSLFLRENRKWKWNTGWVGSGARLSHVCTVLVKIGSSLNKHYQKHFFPCIFP